MFKELALNGGGARGVGMPGVYYALREVDGLWEGIETLAGTSVGSITAALFSVSPEFLDVKNDIFDKNFMGMLNIKSTTLPIGLSLLPLEQFVNDYLKKYIRAYLLINQPLPEALNILLQALDDNYQITFADLALMHQYFPKKFKKLIVTSTTAVAGKAKLCLYDAEKTPHMAIANACAASSSLPAIFEKKVIDKARHFDGGILEPLPSEVFGKAHDTSQRLLFVFGPGPSNLGKLWLKSLYGKPNLDLKLVDTFNTEHSPNVILVKMDDTRQVLEYALPKTDGKVNKISYAELGIEAIEAQWNHQTFAPYAPNFYSHLVHRSQMDSILGNYSFIWVLNLFAPLVKCVLGLPVYIATIYELLCQRLRTLYAFNTVILDSQLTCTSFHQSEKVKRQVAATYYLNTMNHLALYGYLEQADEKFYLEILQNYIRLYQSYLKALNLESDAHLKACHRLGLKSRFLFEKIVEDLGQDPYSPRAMALTLAVEYRLGQIDIPAINKEINQRAEKTALWSFGYFRYSAKNLFLNETMSPANTTPVL